MKWSFTSGFPVKQSRRLGLNRVQHKSALEQIDFETLAPALNGGSEFRLRLRSGQCFALSEHFNLFKVKML